MRASLRQMLPQILFWLFTIFVTHYLTKVSFHQFQVVTDPSHVGTILRDPQLLIYFLNQPLCESTGQGR